MPCVTLTVVSAPPTVAPAKVSPLLVAVAVGGVVTLILAAAAKKRRV
jgi:hypothetical protein